MKKALCFTIIILLLSTSAYAFSPTLTIFARESQTESWAKLYWFTGGDDLRTIERADNINSVLNGQYYFKVVAAWKLEDNLGYKTKEYYFDSLSSVYLFTRSLYTYHTGPAFKD